MAVAAVIPSTDWGASRPYWSAKLLYAVFFLSGVAGLGYQLVWTRMFAVGLGHEMPSLLAVVAAFFAGLSLGAWLLDGLVSRSSRPGHWYVGLEVLIGIWGFVSILLIEPANTLAAGLIGVEPSPFWHWFVAFSLPLVVLLPATTAMGATLPAMERFVAPAARDRRCVGGLYAANTLGAVVGTLASAFVIMPAVGFRATILILAVVNLLCAAVVIAVAGGMATKSSPAMTNPSAEPADPAQRRRIGVTIFFTGLLGVGYEVLGVRVLAQVLENTVYSFAAVLSIYLLGTTIGAALYQRFGRRADFSVVLGYLLCGLATFCMAGMLLLSVAKPVYARARKDMFGDSLMGVMASEMVVALMVFAIPTLLMGATFSHLVQAAKREDGGVGEATATNTLGAALAPLIFGVLLMPLVGAMWSLVVLSLGYLLFVPRAARVWWGFEAVPVLLTLVLLLPGTGLQVITKYPDDKVLDYWEGVSATVAVVQNSDGHRSLRVNNRFQMGTTRGATVESVQAQVPLLLHPAPKRALFLGLGSAITFRSAAFHPGLKADGVELVPEVVEAANRHFMPANLPMGYQQDQRVYVADARRFVRATTNHYDVIIADLFHPGRDGAGLLYTREHFEAVRERLAPGGVFCQWLPLYQLDDPMIRVIVRTFLEVFPHTRGYLADFEIANPMLGLVATLEPMRYGADWYERCVQDGDYKKILQGLFLPHGVRLLGSIIADTQTLRQYAGDGVINTDDFPLVAFKAPIFTSQMDATSYGRLATLLERCSVNIEEMIVLDGDQETRDFVGRLTRFIEARDLYLRGLMAATEGDSTQAFEHFIRSVRASGEFTLGYAHCLNVAQKNVKGQPQMVRDLLVRLIDARPDRNEAKVLLERLFGSV